jgi:3-methyladenine DNA glycosylase AlkD
MPKSPRKPGAKGKSAVPSPAPAKPKASVESALAWLKGHATKKTLEGMARYAIPSDRAFGVAMRDVQNLAKQLGKNHALALGLWATGCYEARLLAIYVDDPACLTAAQMDEWCRDFDNWAVCDTACFGLFKRTAHAWKRLEPWARSEEEFIKRAAFALLWSLSGHDDDATDAQFLQGLKLVEKAADDERNFVKKAVNMALRAVGKRNPKLNAAARALAKRLSASSNAAARWIGKDAWRELSSESVTKRLADRARQGD